MKLRKICALFLIVSAFTVFPALNNLSAVTLQELLERESNLTIRINDIEANKRLIVKRINKIVGILNGNIRSKTLFYHRVIVLDREYNGLFKTIEKLSDEWIWLLYKRDDVVDQIKKIRS